MMGLEGSHTGALPTRESSFPLGADRAQGTATSRRLCRATPHEGQEPRFYPKILPVTLQGLLRLAPWHFQKAAGVCSSTPAGCGGR